MSKNDLTFGTLMLAVLVTFAAAVLVETGATPAQANGNASSQLAARSDSSPASATPIRVAQAASSCVENREQHASR